MKLIIEKNENGYSTQIAPTTGETIKFDYLTFLKELYATGDDLLLEFSGEFNDEEKKLIEDIFRRISDIFKSNA